MIDGETDEKAIAAADVLLRHFGRKCASCRRTDMDDISIAKTSRISRDNAPQPTKAEPPGTATPLPDGVEGRLRVALSTLFGLSPLQLMLVQHIVNGGRLSGFGASLRNLHSRISSYRGSERAQAGMMRNAVLARAPYLAAVLDPLYKGGRAGVGAGVGVGRGQPPADGAGAEAHTGTRHDRSFAAVARQRLDEPQADLFEFANFGNCCQPLKRKTRR